MPIQIVDLALASAEVQREAAQLLVDGFREFAPEAWPTLADGIEEVGGMLVEDRIARAALDDSGHVVGWIGGILQYDGNVCELHPVVVRADLQRHGIGRALVQDLEQQAAARGCTVITLGTDDEIGLTSLAGVDLFPNPLEHLTRIQDRGGHPFGFYQKLGYAVTGIVPDANGFGKPDIWMSKRIKPFSKP